MTAAERPTHAEPALEAVAPVDPAVWNPVSTLRDPETPDETKLAVVEVLASDHSDVTTNVLVDATGDRSLLISMASMKGLLGRPCGQVEGPLVVLLDDPAWQRRAWAAKVLGENGCSTAVKRMTKRLKREPDRRVRANIEAAVATLQSTARR
jgi:hypothetical protein